MTVRLPLLSNSSLNTARRCFREYYFRYVLMRKTRRKTEALRFGSFFHVGLNAWWTCGGDAADKCAAGWGAMIARSEEFPEDSDPFELAKAQELLLGYTARWGDEGYTTLAVEKMFRLPVLRPGEGETRERAPFDMGGAIDAIVERGDVVRNVEHKTTAADIAPGADYWRHVVALDPQVSTYMAAAKSLGFNPRDTLYDAVRKPTIVPGKETVLKKYTKPTKSEPIPRLYANMREADETPKEFRLRLRADIAEKPDWYFQRMSIVRLDRDNEEHARDVWHTAQMIRFAEEHDAWPRSPNACERFHRLCDYHDVCSGLTTIDDDVRFTTKTKQHEELSE